MSGVLTDVVKLQNGSHPFHEPLLLPPHYYLPRTSNSVVLNAYVTVTFPPGYTQLNEDRIRYLETLPADKFRSEIMSLSAKERQELMRFEDFRLKTFESRWPHQKVENINCTSMAGAGFFYGGNSDRVHCAFCSGVLFGWQNSDVPAIEHKKIFPFCPFARGDKNSGNVPKSKDGIILYSTQQLQDLNIKPLKMGLKDVDAQRVSICSYGVSTKVATRPEYASAGARSQTFRTYSNEKRTKPDANNFVEAGFYFTGFEDYVRCFFCNIGLRTWERGELPWTEHARWSPECFYLQTCKGEEWIEEVLDSTPIEKKCEKAIQSKKFKRRQQQKKEVMVEILKDYGYSKSIAKRAWTRDGPFFDIKDWLRSIYKIVDSNPNASDIYSSSDSIFEILDEVEEEGDSSGKASRPKSGILCLGNDPLCSGMPTHICLPCGHVTYCDICAEDKQKTDANKGIYCPNRDCSKEIKGFVKFYTG